jgi:hypothetical protein
MLHQPEAVRQRESRRFADNEAEYMAAVQTAVREAEGIPVDTEVRVSLPAAYEDLSDEGDVWVNHVLDQGLVVEFPRTVGLLGQSRSLVYCTEDWTTSELVAWRYDEVEALGDGWFLTYVY